MPATTTTPTTEADPTAVAAHLRVAVTRLSRMIRQAADTELTPTQMALLLTIAAHGPITLGELARREGVASPTVTKVVARLHERGFLDRIVDETDRRFVRVQVTEAARAMLHELRDHRQAWLAHRLEELDDHQLDVLAQAASIIEQLVAERR